MTAVNETMTALANEVRQLSGTIDKKSINSMTSDIIAANEQITTQMDLIAQIKNAVDSLPEIESEEFDDPTVSRVASLIRKNYGYIDTGIDGANNNLKIEIQYSLMSLLPGDYIRLICAYKGESYNTTRILFYGNYLTYCNLNSMAGGGSLAYSFTRSANTIYTEILQPDTETSFSYIVNKTAPVTLNRVSGASIAGTNLILFPLTSNDNVAIKLYYLKIYDNNELVRDFLPAQKDTEFGLYDKVTQQFFGNIGTGEFLGETKDVRLQEKTVTPTNEIQEIVYDNNYDGLSKVIVNPIPSENDEQIAYISVNINIPVRTDTEKLFYLSSNKEIQSINLIDHQMDSVSLACMAPSIIAVADYDQEVNFNVEGEITKIGNTKCAYFVTGDGTLDYV